MKLGKGRYQKLHRFGAGFVVLCFIVTTVGSVLNGASLYEVCYRAAVVVLGAGFCVWAVVRFWVTVDQMRVTNSIEEDF